MRCLNKPNFFIDAVSGYGSDFVSEFSVFLALMADYNHLSEAEAIRELATYRSVKLRFQEFAISYNINIITGSMPFIENGHVYNVGFL
jgi:hypothetical protein